MITFWKFIYPDTRPIPVIMPAAGTSSSPYSLYAASCDSSRNGDLRVKHCAIKRTITNWCFTFTISYPESNKLVTRSRGNIFPLDVCLVLAFSSPPSEHQSYISLQVTAIFIMSDLLHVNDKYFQLMMSYNKGCQGAFHVNSMPEIRQHVRSSFTPIHRRFSILGT
jgi:hypothetical protein